MRISIYSLYHNVYRRPQKKAYVRKSNDVKCLIDACAPGLICVILSFAIWSVNPKCETQKCVIMYMVKKCLDKVSYGNNKLISLSSVGWCVCYPKAGTVR